MLDLIRFAIALLPLAAYTNVLGLLRLRSVPTVLSGAMDFVLLGLAVIGLMAIGPIELFFPRAAYSLLGIWVWIVLIALYFFMIMLIALNTAPKLIVYGLEARVLKKAVSELLAENEVRSDWLGDIVEIPDFGVRACIEPAGRSAVAQIHSAGKEQSLTGWLTLERLLTHKVATMRIDQKRQAIKWILTSFLLFGVATFFISSDLPRLQQAMSILFGVER
jgi:hypothetical protein